MRYPAFVSIGALVFGAVCHLGFPVTVAGQAAARAGVVTTLQGTATVARSTAPQPTALKFRDDVFVQDHIVTGDSSTVRILLGGKAVVTVRERSALTIHETATTSTIEISGGRIALAVAKERMKPGESVQIKTPNAVCGVRGTVVIAEVAEPGSVGGALTTRFTLLTGVVDVTRLDGGRPAGSVVMLQPLQTVAVIGGLPPGAVRTISRSEAQRTASEYRVSLPTPPAAANGQVAEQQLEHARQQAAALASVGEKPDARPHGKDDQAKGHRDTDGDKSNNRGNGKDQSKNDDKANDMDDKGVRGGVSGISGGGNSAGGGSIGGIVGSIVRGDKQKKPKP